MDHSAAADDEEANFILQAQFQEIFEVGRQFDLCHKMVHGVFREHSVVLPVKPRASRLAFPLPPRQSYWQQQDSKRRDGVQCAPAPSQHRLCFFLSPCPHYEPDPMLINLIFWIKVFTQPPIAHVDSGAPHGFSPFGHVAFAIDSKPPHGFSPCGHVAFAPVQTAYKPSAVLSKRPTSLQPFSLITLPRCVRSSKVRQQLRPRSS